MIEIQRPADLARLRRLALGAQGLLRVAPYGQGLAGARNTISHLGYVQIDTIAVVERAHHHVLHSRVPKFKPAMTQELLRRGEIFEYWTHAAALLPIADYRYSLPYKQAIKAGHTHWFKNPDKQLMGALLARIRTDGPLRSRDLEAGPAKRAGWWDWKPAKRALEQLYMQGDLMVSDREGFQKTYDLPERVLPAQVDVRMPDLAALAAHILNQQLRCHGFASLKGITYQRREPGLRQAMSTLVKEQLAQRMLEQVRVPSGEVFLMASGSLERRTPRMPNRLLILSPFDNAVIQRQRLKTLFAFDYQIECYLPASKRTYGYFCLPLLYQDTFVGRMDCKAHRQARHLQFKALHLEQEGLDEAELLVAFADALARFAIFQQCDSVSLDKVYPKHLMQPLRAVLAHNHK